jgi:hypothetical protein
MRGFKALLCTTALLAPLALLPPADAQISINIGAPPVCSYGYYDYAPYACAPMGITGQAIFTTESSWAWVHGLDGATATGGATIASAIVAEEGIPVDFMVSRPIVGAQMFCVAPNSRGA